MEVSLRSQALGFGQQLNPLHHRTCQKLDFTEGKRETEYMEEEAAD